jgi:hypothetical protein
MKAQGLARDSTLAPRCNPWHASEGFKQNVTTGER